MQIFKTLYITALVLTTNCAIAGAQTVEPADTTDYELSIDENLLEEVVIVAEKNQVSVGTEKRVFNVSSNISATGASARELLSAVPSVDVDSEGEISLRGNSDVLVLIDGKEMGMNDDNRAQFLSQLPAEVVESIEVMTNPSAKNSTGGIAGIINIRLKHNSRNGYFGTAEANVDTHGSVNANFNINFNTGRFQSYAGIGLKSHHTPGGVTSRRVYDDGAYLNSDGHSRKHENSGFLRLGTNFVPNESNQFYISLIGTLGHKWGHTTTTHLSDLPGQWSNNLTNMHENGDTRGANIMLGYKHSFASDHFIDANVSYNIWQGPNDTRSTEDEAWTSGDVSTIWRSQHQDVKISNWEAAIDYSVRFRPWLRLEAGYKGNYNHENSPASYYEGKTPEVLEPLNDLYNRFKYDTDITALYFNFSGKYEHFTYAAGLRGEYWEVATRSLGYGQTDADVPLFKRHEFSLFPTASLSWSFLSDNELALSYARRVRRPFGPQLNTFENISDPSEVHIGNPLIMPEYSNSVELTWMRTWTHHVLSVAGYLRSHSDMISHVSFLAPMASDPTVNTMYYGHANVGNMLNTGVEIMARNTLFTRLTLTTIINLYNSHLKAWDTEYPLHNDFYLVHGDKQDRLVFDFRCMASVRLPWDMTFQATGRYTSRRATAQGTIEPAWDIEAGLRKAAGNWSFSLLCTDIFDSKETHNVLLGNGYTQSIKKWTGGRTLRLAVTYNFGKTLRHVDDHHNHIDTGGYDSHHSH